MRAEIKEQFSNFMDVHNSEKGLARQNSAKIESVYKDVPEIAEEHKIHKDSNGFRNDEYGV